MFLRNGAGVHCHVNLSYSQDYMNFVKQHPLIAVASGMPIIISPLMLFSNDTSGN